MRKYIAKKLISFGLWIYEECGFLEVWDDEDKKNYKRLLRLKKVLK